MFSLIHHDELKAMIERNDAIVILDVLPEDSFLRHHLPGAINLPWGSENFDELAEQLMPDKSMPIVVYCENHDCQKSPKAAARLAELGYKNVSDYENGLTEWEELEAAST